MTQSTHCCARMRDFADGACPADIHERWDCPDCLIHRREDGAYGIIVHDGGTSAVVIGFCPWCGTALPEVPE